MLIAPHEEVAANNAWLFNKGGDIKLRERVPSLFANDAHPRMSENYSFTNTFELLRFATTIGYTPTYIQQSGRSLYSKVMVRMRRDDMFDARLDCPEIILIDSHDGSASIQLRLGWFRFVCSNGMIVGKHLFHRTIKHTAKDVEAQMRLNILDAADIGIGVSTNIERYRYIPVDASNANHIAKKIAEIRIAHKSHEQSFQRETFALGTALMAIRREADKALNLYTFVNRIQENALRGNVSYFFNKKNNTLRPISAIGMQMEINNKCWEVMEEVAGRIAA